jgi:hypothetical protein
VLQIKSIVRVKKQPIDWWLPRLIIGVATTLPMIAGGLLLVLAIPVGMYWVAAAVLLSLAAGVFNTWILLIEILR